MNIFIYSTSPVISHSSSSSTPQGCQIGAGKSGPNLATLAAACCPHFPAPIWQPWLQRLPDRAGKSGSNLATLAAAMPDWCGKSRPNLDPIWQPWLQIGLGNLATLASARCSQGCQIGAGKSRPNLATLAAARCPDFPAPIWQP